MKLSKETMNADWANFYLLCTEKFLILFLTHKLFNFVLFAFLRQVRHCLNKKNAIQFVDLTVFNSKLWKPCIVYSICIGCPLQIKINNEFKNYCHNLYINVLFSGKKNAKLKKWPEIWHQMSL